VGKYPVQAVRRMAEIAGAAEETLYPFDQPVRGAHPKDALIPSALCRAAERTAKDIEAKAIVVVTKTGRSAEFLSDERPRASIMAFSPSLEVVQRLALYWGARPHLSTEGAAEIVQAAERMLVEQKLAASGDPIVVLVGSEADPDTATSIRIANIS